MNENIEYKNKDLADYAGKNVFKTPENYFENFQVNLNQKMRPKSQPIRTQLKNILVWAACFMGFAMGIHFLINLLNKGYLYKNTNWMAEVNSSINEDTYALYYLNQADLIEYVSEDKEIDLQQ